MVVRNQRGKESTASESMFVSIMARSHASPHRGDALEDAVHEVEEALTSIDDSGAEPPEDGSEHLGGTYLLQERGRKRKNEGS